MGRVGRSGTAGLAVLALCLACASPAPRQTVVHVMQKGETIYRLSRHYGVPVRDIVLANGIHDVSDVPVGARIVIPDALRPAADGSLASLPPASRSRAWDEAGLDFAWPVEGRFSSRFGRRGRRVHEGIDITAKPGTPVYAAEAGRVIESGWLGDYGRIVIVKHAGRYSTVYAHNRRNRVRVGAFVEKGQRIADVGSSGNASGPHLHFEIRRDRRPEDPLLYLPSRRADRDEPAPRAASR